MENTQNSNQTQEIKYQIIEENGKSKVIFDDKTYIISTIRAKRFAIRKIKKFTRLAKQMEKLLLVKQEENLDNPLLSLQEISDHLNKKYKYESRHNHATNRKRDDKGRFLSRLQRQQEQLLKGTPTSPIIVADDPHDQQISYLSSQQLVQTINQFDYMAPKFFTINESAPQEPYPETPWLEKRGPLTPNLPHKESMNPLQLFTPLLQFAEDNQNMNLVGMLPMLQEAQSKNDDEDCNENYMGNQMLVIDFIQQKTKKEDTDTGEEEINYFDYLKQESEVANVN